MRRDKVVTFDWSFLLGFSNWMAFFFESHPKTFTVHLLLTALKVMPNQMVKPMTTYSFIVWIIFFELHQLFHRCIFDIQDIRSALLKNADLSRNAQDILEEPFSLHYRKPNSCPALIHARTNSSKPTDKTSKQKTDLTFREFLNHCRLWVRFYDLIY